MAYPINLHTQSGDHLQPEADGQHPNRGPFVNSAGDRYMFSSPFPVVSPAVIDAYRSTDFGATWHLQDAAHHVTRSLNGGGTCACAHPTNRSLVTVFYWQSAGTAGSPGTPNVLNAQDFNIETGLWSGIPYGGAYPFVPSGGFWIDPNLSFVVARPLAGEFVSLSRTTSGVGATYRLQFVRLTPGGTWGPSINAYPGVSATNDVNPGSTNWVMACTADEHIYASLWSTPQVPTGISDLVQSILSPTNTVSTAFMDHYEQIGGSTYASNGGYIAGGNKIFFAMDFSDAGLGRIIVYGGWAVQGGTIAFPYNLGTAGVIGGNGGLTAQIPSLSLNYGTVYVWWEDFTGVGYYVSLDPSLATPVISPVTAAAGFFPSIAVPDEVHNVGGGLVGAFGQTVMSSARNYWEAAVPTSSPAVVAGATSGRLYGAANPSSVCCEATVTPRRPMVDWSALQRAVEARKPRCVPEVRVPVGTLCSKTGRIRTRAI